MPLPLDAATPLHGPSPFVVVASSFAIGTAPRSAALDGLSVRQHGLKSPFSNVALSICRFSHQRAGPAFDGSMYEISMVLMTAYLSYLIVSNRFPAVHSDPPLPTYRWCNANLPLRRFTLLSCRRTGWG